MITKNSYFKGELYIPEAKPSISDEVGGEKDAFNFMVEKFEEDCLVKCLGISLFKEFVENIDTEETTLIKAGSDEKWDKLMNGHDYQLNNKDYFWKGIRFKTPLISNEYNRSFLANYIYFFYNSNKHTMTSSTGEKELVTENANNVTPTVKVVKAWNEFVKLVQGKYQHHAYGYGYLGYNNHVVNNHGMLGVDHYSGEEYKTLYEYIRDMNKSSVVYDNFKPKTWETMNVFNI